MSIQATVGYPGKGMTMQADISASEQVQSIIIDSVVKHVFNQIDCVERFIFNSEKSPDDRERFRSVASDVLERTQDFLYQSECAYCSSFPDVDSFLQAVRTLIFGASLAFYDDHFLLILRYVRSEINALLVDQFSLEAA